jgi:hypothetical protein
VVGDVVGVRALLQNQARELARTASPAQEAPGPSSLVLDRVVSGFRDAWLLVAALELKVFDDLEVPCTPAEFARRRRLPPVAVATLCGDLVAARLLVARDGTVRNTELASRFLRSTAPAYLGPALRARLQSALTADWLADIQREARPEADGRSASPMSQTPWAANDAN